MVHREGLSHLGNLCTLGNVGTSLGVKSFLLTRDGCHYITLASQTGPMLAEKPDLTFRFLELQNPFCFIPCYAAAMEQTFFLLALNNCHIIQALDNILSVNKPTIHSSSTPTLDI